MEQYIKYEELQSAVKRSGKTQKELAEAAGVGQTHISRFLSGQRGLSFFTFRSICKAINKESSEFLTEEGKKALTLEL